MVLQSMAGTEVICDYNTCLKRILTGVSNIIKAFVICDSEEE